VAGDAAGRYRCCGELNGGKPGHPFLTLLGGVCACVLTVQIETHIYRGTESVSQIESEEESLLVSVGDCIRMRTMRCCVTL